MRIEHIAIWTRNLEKSKDFFVKYFDAECGSKYTNTQNHYSSYFLSFPGSLTRLELMHSLNITTSHCFSEASIGLAHFSISVGTKEEVNKLTNQLRSNGFNVITEPRNTGDGYYESVIEDYDGNLIEITI